MTSPDPRGRSPQPIGVGVVHTRGLDPLLQARPGLVDLIEVEPQTTWLFDAQRGTYRLDRDGLHQIRDLAAAFCVHGVGFPVGGTTPPDPRQLDLFGETIEVLGAEWASEHLAWNTTRVGEEELFAGFLLPPEHTPAGVAAAARNIRIVQAALDVPFAVETGVNYLRPRSGDLADHAFVAAVVRATGCGILLDLHNLWCNERNGREKAEDFLAGIPLDHVTEIHVAGGFEHRGFWLDAHSGPVPAEVMTLLTRLLPRLSSLRAVVFEVLESFVPRVGLNAIAAALSELRSVVQATAPAQRLTEAFVPGARAPSIAVTRARAPEGDPLGWEQGLVREVSRPTTGTHAEVRETDPAIELLRELVWRARAGAVSGVLPLTCWLLRESRGGAWMERVMKEWIASSSPHAFQSEEGLCFGDWLVAQRIDLPGLDTLVRFEMAAVRARVTGEEQVERFEEDPFGVRDAVCAGRLPEGVPRGAWELVLTP